MYRKNNLQRNVLITFDEVIFHAPTQHTIDKRMVEPSIITAEERFIRTEIGFKLYNELVTAKNVEVTALNIDTLKAQTKIYDLLEGEIVNGFGFMSTAQQKLWKQQLWKLTAEAVMTSAFPEGFVQMGSGGAFHNNPPAGLMVTSGFVTPLSSSMKWQLDKKILDRISPLIDSLHNYLCINKADFALYDTKKCPECDDTEIKAKFSGISLGMYDEDEDEDCCGPGWLRNTLS
jgi:hypothetical protein